LFTGLLCGLTRPFDLPTDPIRLVEIEGVFSKATKIIAWRDLQNNTVWR